MYQAATLQMEWCLECHRAPEKFVRPKDRIYDMAWRPANTDNEQLAEGVRLKAEYKIQGRQVLESCSTCHR
jgi:mono/diheme cytochrome c family protein